MATTNVPADPGFDTITVEVDGALGRLVLNRPDKLNPLSMHTLKEIELAARWFDEHLDLKVVVVSGAGRSFSAGADLQVVKERMGHASITTTMLYVHTHDEAAVRAALEHG